MAYSFSDLQGLWISAGGPPDQAPLMAAIALAESGGREGVVNEIGACGLWQIHPYEDGCTDPGSNAQMAYRKYRTQGLRAWEAYTNGSYKRYLPQGASAPASALRAGLSSPGKGLVKDQQVDPWGIGQGIADAVGGTGSALKSAGQGLLDSATVGLGLLVMAAGLALVAYLFMTRTDAGRGIARAGREAGSLAAAVAR